MKNAVAGLALASSLVTLAACVAPTSTEGPQTEQKEPSAPAPAPAGLSLDSQSEDVVSGSAVVQGRKLEFLSRQVAPQVFTIEVWSGSLSLTSDVDFTKLQVLFDGFKTETGEDARLSADDKALLEELGKTLAAAGFAKTADDPTHRGSVVHSAGSAMVRALSVWRVTPVEANLRRDFKAVTGRTVKYLCGWLTGYGVQSTHDCWDCWDNWDGWSYVNIGPNGYGANCYPDSCDPSCGNYNIYRCGRMSCEQSGGGGNGNWQWGSNGDKFGACTVWDTNIYPIDCLDHDHCVRNDHSLLSGYCDDMVDNASDDQTFGVDCKMMNGCGGRCGGSYSANGKTCFCDAYCDTYGDCCSDYHLMCDGGTGYNSYLGRSVAKTYNYSSRGGTSGQ